MWKVMILRIWWVNDELWVYFKLYRALAPKAFVVYASCRNKCPGTEGMKGSYIKYLPNGSVKPYSKTHSIYTPTLIER